MKIYFEIDKKPRTVKELLKKGFSTLDGRFKVTYKDSKYKKKQCHSARRSFDDLLNICKTYFPRTKEQRLAKVLFQLNKEIGLGCIFCGTISKLVFHKRGMDLKINQSLPGSLNHYRGVGEYSFNMIKKLAV